MGTRTRPRQGPAAPVRKEALMTAWGQSYPFADRWGAAGRRRKQSYITDENSRRPPHSYRFALDHPRIVEIVLDRLAGKGRRGHQRHALRRAKPVPRPLRDDSHHSRAERERF